MTYVWNKNLINSVALGCLLQSKIFASVCYCCPNGAANRGKLFNTNYKPFKSVNGSLSEEPASITELDSWFSLSITLMILSILGRYKVNRLSIRSICSFNPFISSEKLVWCRSLGSR